MIPTMQILKEDWLIETDATMKILKTLTNESLKVKVYDGGRNLGEIAWHTVISIGEMASHAGLPIDLSAYTENPMDTQIYILTYKNLTEKVFALINEHWSDELLSEKIDIYGEKWSRGYMLEILLRHQTHHRGQMTVLMRQTGLIVPGVYGPSKEEWAAYNMPAEK